MIARCRAYVAPHMGDIGEDDPNRGSDQLVCTPGFCSLDLIAIVAYSNELFTFFGGGQRGTVRDISRATARYASLHVGHVSSS